MHKLFLYVAKIYPIIKSIYKDWLKVRTCIWRSGQILSVRQFIQF